MKTYIFISFLSLLFLCLFLFSCKSKSAIPESEMTMADRIFEKTLQAHGGEKYNTAHYSFIFRKNQYTFQNKKESYKYTLKGTKNDKDFYHEYENGKFKRLVEGVEQELTPKQINGYSNSLNSVIYFATLPHKLFDPAVTKIYKNETTIKGQKYFVFEIRFSEEGGGDDHDDIYHYWINQETYFIDYLAYNFQVNGGGVRFRSAYNPRTVDGIRFQDYINYKAPVGTPLAELPRLLEKNELKKLSLIETEQVVNLKK